MKILPLLETIFGDTTQDSTLTNNGCEIYSSIDSFVYQSSTWTRYAISLGF